MADGEGYSGWTNQETWAVQQLISNDQHYFNDCRMIARELGADVLQRAVESSVETALDRMRRRSSVAESLVTEMMIIAMKRVNWQEIVDMWSEGQDGD